MIPNFEHSEHYELLSAYLDGELSPQETARVESLLATDNNLRLEYQKLLRLRQALRRLPMSTVANNPEQLSQRVFAKVNQQRRHRRRWLWGGGAIAALSVTVLSGLLSPEGKMIPQLARSRNHEQGLVIALNKISKEQLKQSRYQSLEQNLMIKLNEPVIDLYQ